MNRGGSRQSPRPLVDALRARRKFLKLTAYHVDYNMLFGSGISVAKYECGERNPSMRKLIDWADALNCDVTIVPRDTKSGDAAVEDEGDWL